MTENQQKVIVWQNVIYILIALATVFCSVVQYFYPNTLKTMFREEDHTHFELEEFALITLENPTMAICR